MGKAAFTLTRDQVLSWRLRRQALDPAMATTAVDVLERVLAIRGWPDDVASLAIGVRQANPDRDSLSQAIGDGALIRSYAFRGGSYLFTPAIGSVLLAVRTATRIWETARWQHQGSFAIDGWEPFRHEVREVLADGPKTRGEIAAHLERLPALRHLAVAAAGTGADSLYKPLHWWGDICFGPARNGQATFRLLAGDPLWPGLPDVDHAGRRAIVLYLGAYGPATMGNLMYWLTEGLGVPRRRLAGWIADLGDEVSVIPTEAGESYALAADLEELATATPSESVHLLPAFDPWVLNPGTADARIVPSARRSLATRGANLVIRGGQMTGTWRIRNQTLAISWFPEAGSPPGPAIDAAASCLATFLDRPLSAEIRVEP